jgi:hypothetical protein
MTNRASNTIPSDYVNVCETVRRVLTTSALRRRCRELEFKGERVDQESTHVMPLAKSKKIYVEKRCLYCVSERNPKVETHNVEECFILEKKAQLHESRTDDAERSVHSKDSEEKKNYRTQRITDNTTSGSLDYYMGDI